MTNLNSRVRMNVEVKPPAAAYKLLIEKDVDVPMRDGARLEGRRVPAGRRRKIPGDPQSRAVPEGQALGAAAAA